MNKVNVTKMIIHADATKEAVYTIGRREENMTKLKTLIVLDLLAWKLARVVESIKEPNSRVKLVNGIYTNIPGRVLKGNAYDSILETIDELNNQHGIDIEEELKDTAILAAGMNEITEKETDRELMDKIKKIEFDDVSSMYPNEVVTTFLNHNKGK